MTRRLYNWTFQDVAAFLKHHGFSHVHTRGSHYYFSATIKGRTRLVEVPHHTKKVIKPRTFKDSIIRKSGITKKHWTECKRKRCREI